MLETLVFLCGAVVMGLELVGSRILAPHFGSDIFVWGSLIGVFMAALAAGYYLGGILADRCPNPAVLAWLAAGAGLLIGLLPLAESSVAQEIAQAGLGPRGGPLLAATALFFLPTMLLGTISPFAVRLKFTALAGLGRTAGGLYALSTAGSIAGTLATAFYLIPWLNTPGLLRTLAAGATGAGALYLLAVRRPGQALAAAALVPLLVLAAAAPPPLVSDRGPFGGTARLIYEEQSRYHQIRVMDGEGNRYLRFGRSWQSGMRLDGPAESIFAYTGYFRLNRLLQPEPRRALFIGLGGGLAPRDFWQRHPNLQVDVAEIDPAVVAVARKYFRLPADPRLRVVAQDGRQFLAGSRQSYDLIVVDAYTADSIPFHLTTREFMALVDQHLNPGGVVAFNVIAALEGPRSRLYRAFLRTVGERFGGVYPVAVDWHLYPSARLNRNIILLASPAAGPGPEGFMERAAADPALAVMALGLQPLPADLGDALLLEDDHAPVDDLMKALG